MAHETLSKMQHVRRTSPSGCIFISSSQYLALLALSLSNASPPLARRAQAHALSFSSSGILEIAAHPRRTLLVHPHQQSARYSSLPLLSLQSKDLLTPEEEDVSMADYPSHLKHKIASSAAKSERRSQERSATGRPLCAGCDRPPSLCVCDALPVLTGAGDGTDSDIKKGERYKLSTRHTDIVILQHPNEFRKRHFSTVPLINLVLNNVTIKVGYDFNDEDVLARLGILPVEAIKSQKMPLLLFPGDHAIDLDHVAKQRQEYSMLNDYDLTADIDCTDDGPAQGNMLVLIDGTWAEAKRMARNSPALLERCQMVQFPAASSSSADSTGKISSSNDRNDQKVMIDEHPSLYHAVRREPEAHCLSTLEACARALDMLEPRVTDSWSDTDMSADDVDVMVHPTPSDALKLVLAKHVESHLSNARSSRTARFSKDASGVWARNRRTWEIKNAIFNGEKDADNGMEENQPDRGRNRLADEDNTTKNTVIKRIEDGSSIRQLRLVDAQLIDLWWDHRSTSSLAAVARCISADIDGNIGSCLGIFGPDDELRAGIVRYAGGSVGMLYVTEPYRRRGYGEALLRQATTAIKAIGDECVALILDGNMASEATFSKAGWERVNPTLKKGTGSRRANRKWVKR